MNRARGERTPGGRSWRRFRTVRAGAVWLGLLALAACGAPQAGQLLDDPGSLPQAVEMTDVPFFPQERYYCGPAALATVLAWSGLEVTQDDLVEQVYTPGRQGTLRSDIVAGARRNGRLAVPVNSLADLLTELDAGHPVLVFQNLALDWYPQWHFAVAVGYDLGTGDLFLRSGTQERRVTRLSTFEHTWRRGDYWALTVLPPDRLPQTASELEVLQAASGLEQTGRPVDAMTAYQTALVRWPDSLSALMGLGNTRYALGDREGAREAFAEAIGRHPQAPAAWNNLAVVLAELGRPTDALDAAREAVRLGDGAPIYRETLGEITGPVI